MKKGIKIFIALVILAAIVVAAVIVFLREGPSMPEGRFYPEIGGVVQTDATMSVFEFRGGGRVTHYAGLMTTSMFYRISGDRLIISEARGGAGLEYALGSNRRYFSQDLGFGLIPGLDLQMRWVLVD